MDMTKEKKNEPDRVELRSLDPSVARREELGRLFPETLTEGGKIDFDQLKRALGETVDAGRERYGLVWSGKAECFKSIQAPSVATLRPAPDESVNFDTTDNLIIEGDNLEVLKLLQKSYLGKVKMIYIDPPYNTGNDFIYPDNYAESLQTYLEYTGQVDAEGRKFGTNTEADGRFHSKWLNMMYPRLYLARNLLRDDGVIFITADNQEVENLQRIAQEIFGEENFVTTVVWQKKVSPANDAKWFSSDHDYIVIFARNKETWRPNGLDRTEAQTSYYKNPDNDPRGDWNSATYTCNKTKDERPNLYYPIVNPNTGDEVWPKETAVWKYGKELARQHIGEKRLYWGSDGMALFPRIKLFLSEMDKVVPRSIWSYADVGHTQEATNELKALVGDTGFETPKPSRLIRRMLEIATDDTVDFIVLDFFAGSGTTAHAVLDQNRKDGGSRRYILVQLPEPTGRDDYSTIADIAKERVRRVGKKLDDENNSKLDFEKSGKHDRGFQVFKLAESNFKTWDANAARDAQTLATQLDLHMDHLREGRDAKDFLYEILLKSGFSLTARIENVPLAGQTVFSVAGGALLVCLDRKLTLEAIRLMADRKPERVVCLDEGFAGNDQLKTNAVQTFKSKGVVFRTV